MYIARWPLKLYPALCKLYSASWKFTKTPYVHVHILQIKAVNQNQTVHLNEAKEHGEDDRINPGLKEGILNITTNIKCPFVLFNLNFLIVFFECCP